uniref:Uncharacterized protein n=1 Tax=Plectus sambesii TaxID=2011161 RepID=A0A914XPI6_9BILA
MLDCGCRLRQHQTVRYQQLTNVVSPAMRNRRSCVSTTTTEQITREHCDSTKNLVTLQVLTELRSMLYQFEAVMSAQRANEQVKEQWSRLADVLENFSLCVFLFGTLICIQLFLNHSWY